MTALRTRFFLIEIMINEDHTDDLEDNFGLIGAGRKQSEEPTYR